MTKVTCACPPDVAASTLHRTLGCPPEKFHIDDRWMTRDEAYAWQLEQVSPPSRPGRAHNPQTCHGPCDACADLAYDLSVGNEPVR